MIFRRFDVHCLARVKRWGIKGQQQSPIAGDCHIVAVAHAAWDDDKITNRSGCGIGAGDYHKFALQDIESMLGIWMKVERRSACHLEIVQPRLWRRIQWPQAATWRNVGRTVRYHIGAVNDFSHTCPFFRMTS